MERRNRLKRSEDPRALKSRQALHSALLDILETRAFEQITIKQLAAAAGVSYPVFFRHFTSMDDLLTDVAADEVRGLLALTQPIANEAVATSNLEEMCRFVQRRRRLWKCLLTAGAASTMRSEFARIAAEIGHTGPQANPWLPIELASSFVAAGIFEVLAWWLNQPEDYPVDNVVKILNALIARPLALPQQVELR